MTNIPSKEMIDYIINKVYVNHKKTDVQLADFYTTSP